MRMSFFKAAASALLIFLVQIIAVEAAEVKVLSSGAIVPIMNELIPQFERDTGHKVAIRYDFGPVLKRQIEAGEFFDVAIVSFDIDDLVRQGKLAAATRVLIGRTGIGVGVRKGAPKPDISTTEALKHTLLNAKSVAYSKEGSSGLYFLGLLDRLGISGDMKGKLHGTGGADNPAEAVAKGEAEMTVVGVALILMIPGAEFVGWLPAELQNYVVFTAGMSAAAKEAEAGKALLNFLTTPASRAAFKARGARGIEPLGR